MSSLWPLCHDDQLDNLVLLRAPRLLVVHGSHHVPPWNPAAGRRRVRDNFFHEAELGQFSRRASNVRCETLSCITNSSDQHNAVFWGCRQRGAASRTAAGGRGQLGGARSMKPRGPKKARLRVPALHVSRPLEATPWPSRGSTTRGSASASGQRRRSSSYNLSHV